MSRVALQINERRSAGSRRALGLLGLLAVLGWTGCFPSGVRPERAAEAQIRERIATIREAILVKSVAGIVRWGTPERKELPADAAAR